MYFHKDVNTLTKWQMCTHRYLLNDSIHTYLQKDITRALLYSPRSTSSHHRLTHTHTHTHTQPPQSSVSRYTHSHAHTHTYLHSITHTLIPTFPKSADTQS